MADTLPSGKKNLIDCVLALISFFVFLAVIFLNVLFFRSIHFVSILLFLIPTAVFVLFWRYQVKHALGKTMIIVIRTVCIAVSIVFIFLNLCSMVINELGNPVTDAAYYQRLLRSYPQDEYMAHFPKTVPTDAKNVKLFEMGATDFLLKYDATPDEINRIVTKYEGKAQVVIDMGEYNSGRYIPDGNVYFPAFFSEITGDDGQGLPDDFKLYILINDPNSNWNHGASSGIAVSTQRHQVIYWFERS